jgi:hypothetical protein
MLKHLFLSLILILFLTSCQVITSASGTQPTPVESVSYPPTASPNPTEIVSTLPVPSPTPLPADPALAQQAAIAALSQDKGIPSDQIQLVSTTAIEWGDRCLGVVIPGVLCAQGPVPGYLIMLSAYGSAYEYHTNQDGTNVLMVRSPFVRIAVRQPDGSVQIVPIDTQNTLQAATPAAQSFLPSGGTARGTVYALNFGETATVTATDASGTRTLDFIKNPNYALAVWPGDASHSPLLAWGSYLNSETMQAELFVSAPDGSGLVTLLSEKVEMPLYQLIAQRFSADGKYLYFSKEPYGIGGYILYGGASSLYRMDLASRQIEELIPLDRQAAQSPFICLDAFSMDYSLVADHCSPYVITVRSLDTGHSVTILPPAVVKDRSIVGSARFSPDGSRLAFAGAKGDPEAEQGWLAVSNGLGSSSSLIITSQPDQYFVVLGWLNDSTLLVQTNTSMCRAAECPNQVWTVAVDGSSQIKVAEGTFITLVDGYVP